MTTECPFYPGNKCYGSCSNHDDNIQNLMDESNVKNVTIATLEAEMRVDVLRFAKAKAISITENGYYEACDYYPQN